MSSVLLHVYRYLSFINIMLYVKKSFEDCVFHARNQLGMCATFHSRRCWGHAVWTLVSATCSLHLTVTSMVCARTVRLMEESSGSPLGACATARSRVACRCGILPITCVTCLGGGSVRVGVRFGFLYEHVFACDYQTRTGVELTFTPTVIFASLYV